MGKKSRCIGAHVSAEDYDRILKVLDKRGLSMSAFIRIVIRAALRKEGV